MGFTVGDTLSGELLRLALDADSGRLKHVAVLAHSARGALLVELVDRGVIRRSAGDTQIDTAPTGLPLADDLIAHVVAHPTHDVEYWLQRGVPHLHEFVAELVADGDWTIERRTVLPTHARYTDVRSAEFGRLRETLVAVAADPERADGARQAALAALCVPVGLLGQHTEPTGPSPELLAACGELSWIVSAVTDFVVVAQADDLAAGMVNTVTNAAQVASI